MSLQGSGTPATSPRSAVPVNQVDSGYASHDSSVPPTPEQKDAQGRVLSQRTNLHRFVPSFKRQKLSIPTNLNKYEKSLEKAVWDRYYDIVGRLQDGLKKCMNNKDGKVSQGLVIRIMVLGETYDVTKPYIIVCCPKSKIKTVEEFLMQSSIKSLYQPSDPGQVSFGIAVTGPPKPKNAGSDFEVYGSPDCTRLIGWNSSSAIIRVIGEDGKRYATMGGIIKISKTDGEYALCGLTAGHIIDTIDDDDDENDDENDDEDEMSTDGESECDHDNHTQNGDAPTYSPKTADAVAKANLEFQPEWSRVGTITAESRPKEALDRDWALVVDLDNRFQRSNKIQKMNGSSTPQPRRELTLGTGETISEGSTRTVVLASSILQKDAYSQLGHLSNTGAVALFGADFVSVYTMTLDNGAALPYGSSGSWVIDKDSCEIYGHAVADDAFGDIFVVPIRDIFADIEKMEGVKAVTLPSDIDVISHSSLLETTMELVPRTNLHPASVDQDVRVEGESAMEVSPRYTPQESPPVPPAEPGEVHGMMPLGSMSLPESLSGSPHSQEPYHQDSAKEAQLFPDFAQMYPSYNQPQWFSPYQPPMFEMFSGSPFTMRSGPHHQAFQPQGQYPHSQYPQGQYPQNSLQSQHLQSQHLQSQFPQSQYAQSQFPPSQYPPSQYPQGQHPPSWMAQRPQSQAYPPAQFYPQYHGAPTPFPPSLPTPDLTPDTSPDPTPTTSLNTSPSARPPNSGPSNPYGSTFIRGLYASDPPSARPMELYSDKRKREGGRRRQT